MEFTVAKLQKIIQIIHNLGTGIKCVETDFVCPRFFGDHAHILDEEIIEIGKSIVIKKFHKSLPALLTSPYSLFYIGALYYISHTQHPNKRQNIIELNVVYAKIMFSFLMKSYIKYNFKKEIMIRAIENSKSKYLKQGGVEFVAEKLGGLITNRFLSENIDEPLTYIKIFYKLRHHVAQIVKYIVKEYYNFKEMKTDEKRDYSSIVLSNLSLVYRSDRIGDCKESAKIIASEYTKYIDEFETLVSLIVNENTPYNKIKNSHLYVKLVNYLGLEKPECLYNVIKLAFELVSSLLLELV